MRIIGIVFFLFLNSSLIFAQQDSTKYEIYDVIHLTDGSVLRGNILAYDSQLGSISFRDLKGRVYNFSREEYKYFLEKQAFPIKKDKSKKPLRARNTQGIRYNLGTDLNSYHVWEYESDADLSRNYRLSGGTVSVTGTVGKNFSNKHYLGLSAAVGALSHPKYYNLGARYNYIYDNQERNVAFYIPVEVKYQQMILEATELPYTEITPNSSSSGYYFPKSLFSSVFLSVGHGFGFVLKNGGTFNIELAYQHHFVANQKFVDELKLLDVGYSPKHQIRSFRLGFSISF